MPQADDSNFWKKVRQQHLVVESDNVSLLKKWEAEHSSAEWHIFETCPHLAS